MDTGIKWEDVSYRVRANGRTKCARPASLSELNQSSSESKVASKKSESQEENKRGKPVTSISRLAVCSSKQRQGFSVFLLETATVCFL